MEITVDQFKQAAWENDFDTVRRYVEAGGDVNAMASNGVNALVTFNLEILDYLDKNGGDPGLKWADGNPSVCFHAWEVNAESVRWFLDKGVDPNTAHRDTGEGCLHALCSKPDRPKERRQIIELLLVRGADPNARAATGVETGCFMRDVRVVGETPLHRAAAYQPKEIIELLLTNGADPAIEDSREESPLSWASRHWRARDVLRLLHYGEHPRVR